jgi:hypothetical protein
MASSYASPVFQATHLICMDFQLKCGINGKELADITPMDATLRLPPAESSL